MKLIIVAVLLISCWTLAGAGWGQVPGAEIIPPAASPSLMTIPGLSDAVATYAKQAKVVGQISMSGKLGTGFFLPVRTLKDGSGIRYAAAGLGGIVMEGGHFRPQVLGLIDLSSCFRRIEDRNAWYKSHVEKIILPDFWLGLSAGPPAIGESVTWRDFGRWKTWADHAYATVAIGL